ncbi:suppressor of cytokine signaling 2-like [Gigantopelta aegis]|uniref:suppressor of cytokine signaling 2-like n=1 Tax=Gigantopelta aegis TaxID=1735272 RepID=UPI001B88D196|nr:suppressor of cytokine signaling 2-like [Gigantopelta aegis]
MPPESVMVMANHLVIRTVRHSSNKNKIDIPNNNLDCFSPCKSLGRVEKLKGVKEEQKTTTPPPQKAPVYQYLPVLPEHDFEALHKSLEMLAQSYWYFTDFGSVDAKAHLASMAVGTFLVRDSSDPKYLFSLSVKTERGATSVRIKYVRGLFQFDCEETIKHSLPKFENVVELVDFHVTLCRDDTASRCRWLETSGRRDMAVKLKKPCFSGVPSLKHMSRVATNKSLKDLHFPQRSSALLPIPDTVKQYLQQYPYKV